MPVEVAGAADSITIGPKTAFAGGAVAGIEIIDGGFVDLKFAGLEDFLADGLIDGGDSRTIPERLKEAVNHAGARRGLALKTRQTYGSWVARYGAGLRLTELVQLRIKDVDIDRGVVTVHAGKGDKDYPRLRRRSAQCKGAPPRPRRMGGAPRCLWQ
jgi:integrase